MADFLRGALPSPKSRLASAVPHLAGAAPDSFGVLPLKLQTWANDRFGDCVTAEECAAKAWFSTFRDQPELLIPDSVCVSWARQHGYLNGANLTDVMDSMSHDGIEVDGKLYKDGPAQSVNWTNFSALASAIFQGPVKIALAANQLQSAGAGQSMGWIGSGWRHDRNTDHCVGLWGYGTAQQLAEQMNKTLGMSVSLGYLAPQAPSVYLFTWGTVGIVEFQSMVNITDEAWLRTPTTVPDPGVPPSPLPGPAPAPVRSGTIVIDLGSNSVLAPAHTVISPTPTPGYSYDPTTGTISGPDGLILVPPSAN